MGQPRGAAGNGSRPLVAAGTMQAITQRAYGSPEVLTLTTVPRPVPKADEVLVAVRASSLNFADVAMITGRPSLIRTVSGLRRPKHPVPGKDLAG